MTRRNTPEEQEAARLRHNLRAKKYREANYEKQKAATVAWREHFPERARASTNNWYDKPENKEKTRDTYLRRTYGITLKQEQAMLQAQNNCCPICKTPTPGKTRNPNKSGWHVDHNHTTMAVRSILCNSCNKALAFAKDNPELLRKMARYLEWHLENAYTKDDSELLTKMARCLEEHLG
jgi:hypothetical protein